MNVFLILYKNLHCGHSIEASWQGASNEYPQNIFSKKNKKNIHTFRLKKCHIWSSTDLNPLDWHASIQPIALWAFVFP